MKDKSRSNRQIEAKPEQIERASGQAGDAPGASNRLLESMIEQSPFAMWISDDTGTVIRTNSALRETLGLDDEQILGRYNVLNDRNLAEQGVMDQVRAVFEKQTPTRFSISWDAAKAGDVDFEGARDLWIDASLFPIVDEKGNLTHVGCQWVDISERRLALRQLEESEFRLRQMTDNIGDVFWITEWDSNRTVFASSSYEEIWGRSLESLYGDPKGWADAIHEEDRDRAWETFITLGEGATYDEEYRIIRPDGTVRWIRDRGYPIRDQQGKVARAVGVAQDITERVRAEKERAQAEVALQQYVERLRTLHAIDGAILAAWSAEDVARAVLRHIRQLIPCQRASVTAINVDAQEAVVLALSSDVESSMKVGMRIPLESVGVIADLRDGKVHVVEDIESLPRRSKLEQELLAAGVRSFINVPLIAHGILVGSLNLGTSQVDGFSSDHVDIASELANQLAIAVRQARLFEQVQRHAEELEQQVAARTAELGRRTVQLQVAAEVARDATTAHDLDELLNRSVNLVRERFGFYHAGIFLTDEQGEYAVLRSATGEAGQRMLEQGHKLRIGEAGMVGHVCASGEPRTALDTGTDAVHFDNPHLPDTRSEMALPMHVGGHVIGALDVQSTKEAAFDQDDIEILQVMADQLAVTIERTRLFEQVQATLEERLRAVISNAPIAVTATDAEGVVTLLEGKGLEGTGLVPDEVVGQSVFDVFQDNPQVLQNVQRALGGETFVALVQMGYLLFETQYSPLKDQAGETAGIISVAVDVSEHHRMQAQIQQQARLAAVGQLAGGIAHDFNNFLMTIIFYAHLLQNRTETTDITALADTIMGESKRAADLVRQVLDFSRRSAIETKPVDLASFVEEVIDILRRTLPESIRVVTEIGEGDYLVEIDPTRTQQVIMNLALNSRDAMPEGGDLRIELSTVTVGSSRMGPSGIPDLELAPGDWVCLSVQDTGTGMDEHVRAHLFEPFFTTKGLEGNGLGLAQVYGIVKQHGGEIGVETKLGRGTTFRIYFPVHSSDQAESAREGQATATPPGRGETILFVEDEDKVRDAGRHVLESLGYRVLVAANGREGLEVFQESKVDLVVTDMVMPDMGGREMILALRQIAPGVKTLVVTGYTMQEDIKALKDSGITDVIHKPLDVDTLAQAVRRLLDARRGMT